MTYQDPRPDEDRRGAIVWAPIAILAWIVIALIARAAFASG